MRKFFIGICAIFIACEYVVATCISGCLDIPLIITKGKTEESKFKNLDRETADEINKIKDMIDESHNEVEKDSKTILENTRSLNRQYYIVEQNILHNQILINELQNILIDAISASAEAKKSKDNLKILKRKLQE